MSGLLCASWRRLTTPPRLIPQPHTTGIAAQDWATASADPQYRAAVVDLLGALAYGELAAFERLAEDAKLAPTLADKAELAKMASAEFHHFEQLRDRLAAIEAEPTRRWSRSPRRSTSSTARPRPRTGWRAWSRRTSATRSPVTSTARSRPGWTPTPAALVLAVLDDTGHASFAVEKVRAAIEAEPRVGGRLALWARRLMGEALSQAQRVVADRDALSTMLVGGVADGFDLAEVGRMFSRITEAHTKRMAALGLAA